MTNDTFLAALRQDPDDDITRLVYADWLEDHGHADRADFIRVQTTLDRLSPYDPAVPDLERRQRELLVRHERGWVCSTPPGVTWEWRKGFVDRLVLAFDVPFPRAADLFARHPVRELDVRASYNFEHFLHESLLPRVRSLRFPQFNWCSDPAGLARFLSSPQLANLQELSLSHNALDRQFLEILAEAGPEGLRSLHLCHGSFAADDLRAFLQAPRLHSLDEFSLLAPRTDLREDGLGVLTADASRWRRLHIAGVPPAEAIARLQHCPHLRHLHLAVPPRASRQPILGPNLEVLELPEDEGWLERLAGDEKLGQLKRLQLYAEETNLDQFRDLDRIVQRFQGPGLVLRVDRPTMGTAPSQRVLDALVGLVLGRVGYLGSLRAGCAPWLTDLELTPIRDEAIQDLAAMLRSGWAPQMRSFQLVTGTSARAILNALTGSAGPRHLRSLSLAIPWNRSGIQQLAEWPALWHLDRLILTPAGMGELDDDVLAPLARSPYLCPLTHVRVQADPSSAVVAQFHERLGSRFCFIPF